MTARSRKLAILAIVLSAAMLTNCGPKLPPDLSPEANLALRGRQATASVKVALDQIEPLVAAGVMNAREAIVVVEGLQLVNQTIGELAGVLAIVDQLKETEERRKGLLAAANLLPRAGAQLQRILDRPELRTRPEVRERVGQILQGIADVLNVIAAFMPMPAPAAAGVKG